MRHPLFNWWLRFKQSRGYGIHSSFAFDLITNVLYPRYGYYAYWDIPKILLENGLSVPAAFSFNQLSFRLVHYLNAKNILEINAAEGVNTCYIIAPASDIRCVCLERNQEKAAIARKLLTATGHQCEFVTRMPLAGTQLFDMIFINLKEQVTTQGDDGFSIETLLKLSHENTCWVISPIKSRQSKQFWSAIVHDKHVSITFDMKQMGIAFLRRSYYKMHYFV